MGMVGRGSDRQDLADWLDPMDLSVIVNKHDHWLLPAVELRLGKISRRLAQDLIGLAKLPVLPLQRLEPVRNIRWHAGSFAAVDLGLLDPLMQRLRRTAETFDEIDTTAAQREACSPSCSRTIRTARVRTSGENLFVVLLVMAPGAVQCEPLLETSSIKMEDRYGSVKASGRCSLTTTPLSSFRWGGENHRSV